MTELRGKNFVLQKLQQRGITWIELRYRLAGHSTGRLTLAAAELGGVFDDGLAHTASGVGRLVLNPDPASFVLSRANLDADAPVTAAIHCDVQRPDGAPHPLCTRSVLKRLLARAAHRDEGFYLGARIELRWLASAPASPGARRVAAPTTIADALSRSLARRLERDGHAIHNWHVRSEPAHVAFDFHQLDPLGLSDTLASFRLLAAAVAAESGAAVSWLPRMSATAAPLRLELRLGREANDGRAWDDALSSDGLSAEATAFRERIQADSPALSLCLRVGVNGWNSDEPFAVAIAGSERGGESASLAVGGLDAAADPWLAAALVLGLALADSAPAQGPEIPGPARVIAARQSKLMRAVLGDVLVDTLVTAATGELRLYAGHVSGFERSREPEA